MAIAEQHNPKLLLLGVSMVIHTDNNGAKVSKNIDDRIDFHWLHVWIVGTAASFGSCPFNVLGWILDIAGFAMNAVLRIDLQARI